MKIETDDWITITEAAKESGIPDAVTRRLARDLGVLREFFGVRVIRRSDVVKLVENRRRRGNPRWIESYEEASEAAILAVKSRVKNQKARAAKRPV
jgi:hypothetical protein